MRAPVRPLRALIRDRKAATAVEYGLICALIVLTLMVALIALGATTAGMWNNIHDQVQAH